MSLKDSLPITNKSGHELWLLLIDHERHEWSVFKFEHDLGTSIHQDRKQHIELNFFASEWEAIEWVSQAPVLSKYELGQFPMGGPTNVENHGAGCPKCGEYVVTPDLHLCTDHKAYLLFRVSDREGLVALEPDKIASLVWVPRREHAGDTVKITLHSGEQGMFEVHHENATALLRCLRKEKL